MGAIEATHFFCSCGGPGLLVDVEPVLEHCEIRRTLFHYNITQNKYQQENCYGCRIQSERAPVLGCDCGRFLPGQILQVINRLYNPNIPAIWYPGRGALNQSYIRDSFAWVAISEVHLRSNTYDKLIGNDQIKIWQLQMIAGLWWENLWPTSKTTLTSLS